MQLVTRNDLPNVNSCYPIQVCLGIEPLSCMASTTETLTCTSVCWPFELTPVLSSCTCTGNFSKRFIKALVQEHQSIGCKQWPWCHWKLIGTHGFFDISVRSTFACDHHSCKQIPIFTQLHTIVLISYFDFFPRSLPGGELLLFHVVPEIDFLFFHSLFYKSLK